MNHTDFQKYFFLLLTYRRKYVVEKVLKSTYRISILNIMKQLYKDLKTQTRVTLLRP